MRIEQERFIDFLGKPDTRFVIPVFQRVYSWDARQCQELWGDVMAAGADEGAEPHFMGMLLYSEESEAFEGAAQLNVIDGQQRLTTISLLLCALARHLDEAKTEAGGEAGEPGMSAHEIFATYLRLGSGARVAGKLALSFMDRDTLYALVGAGVMPDEPAGRLIDNLELFYQNMRKPGFDANRLWRGLGCLEVASVLLAHGDSPQLVFESLNSKGMALTTADRVRNYIVVTDDAGAGGADGEGAVFERSWLPFEQLFADAPEGFDANTALNTWLASRYRATRIFDESEAYGLFKRCLHDEFGEDVGALLENAAAYARELLADDARRAKEVADAQVWMSGTPKDLISEYKMFGD